MKQHITFRPALLALGVAIASQAQAIRLSDIEVASFLDEPLKARIEIKDATNTQLDSFIASLAPQESFRRAGIELTDELANISFQKGPNGQYLYVSTEQPIREPFLLFLLRGDWPGGSLTREYALLLDLPGTTSLPKFDLPSTQVSGVRGFAVPDNIPSQAPTRAEELQQRIQQAAQIEPAADTQPAAVKVATEVIQTAASEAVSVVVRSGDTLSKIARQYFDPSLAPDANAFMQALFELNPQAFIKGNINLIRAGVTLTIPAPQSTQIATNAPSPLAPLVEMDVQADGLRLVTNEPSASSLMDTEAEFLRQRVQELELQLAQLQLRGGDRNEVGNLIAETTGTALTPLTQVDPTATSQGNDESPFEAIAPVIAQVPSTAPRPSEPEPNPEPATASIAPVTPAAEATLKTQTTPPTSSWWQEPLNAGIAGGGSILALFLGWWAYRRRSQTTAPFVPSILADEPLSAEPMYAEDEPLPETMGQRLNPARQGADRTDEIHQIIETARVLCAYGQVENALLALDDQIDRWDNRVDPRIIDQKLRILRAKRPQDVAEFVSTSRARWTGNSQLLKALGSAPVLAEDIEEHMDLDNTDFNLNLTDSSSEVSEIDMGTAPLPGVSFAGTSPEPAPKPTSTAVSHSNTIEFTLEDTTDNK